MGLLDKAIRDEKSRLYDLKDKTESEVISYNNIDYMSSLMMKLISIIPM